MGQEELTVKIFKALGHPLRYRIIRFLADGPRCVCELNADVEFSQSNLSQHLRLLKEAGLIESEKVGMKVIYGLRDPEALGVFLGAAGVYTERYVKVLQKNLNRAGKQPAGGSAAARTRQKKE